jgi:uncharacterized membrane protein YphA (DoxX/SURF4 family)
MPLTGRATKQTNFYLHHMSLSSKLDQLHHQTRQNKWHRYFSIFTRIALAAGFIPSGITKISGEHFTGLTAMHPMGHYLLAWYRTGWYYTTVGVLQVTAAILLLIPFTATLGAVIYFPIILNICLLSLSVRFEGSLITSPLMVLANLYLFWWDYHKLKYILPFNHTAAKKFLPKPTNNKFPIRFFAAGFATVVIIVLLLLNVFSIVPRNTLKDCNTQCEDSNNPQACYNFCDCIHNQGQSVDSCLKVYNKAINEAKHKK